MIRNFLAALCLLVVPTFLGLRGAYAQTTSGRFDSLSTAGQTLSADTQLAQLFYEAGIFTAEFDPNMPSGIAVIVDCAVASHYRDLAEQTIAAAYSAYSVARARYDVTSATIRDALEDNATSAELDELYSELASDLTAMNSAEAYYNLCNAALGPALSTLNTILGAAGC